MQAILTNVPAPLLFIGIYLTTGDLYWATAGLMAGSLFSLAVEYLYAKRENKSIRTSTWLTVGMIWVFGGLTLTLHDPMFIKAKSSVIGVLIALFLLGLPWFSVGQKLIDKLLSWASQQDASSPWHALDANKVAMLRYIWAGYGLTLALSNAFFWLYQSEASWVQFKTYGGFILSLLFMAPTLYYLLRSRKDNGS